MPSATRYLRSKDDRTQIAVEMTDELHALVWGRLGLSVEPYSVPLVEVADPVAWVRAERVKLQVSTTDRMAGLRAKWAAREGSDLALAESAVAERISDNPRTVDWFGLATALTDARVRDLNAGVAR